MPAQIYSSCKLVDAPWQPGRHCLRALAVVQEAVIALALAAMAASALRALAVTVTSCWKDWAICLKSSRHTTLPLALLSSSSESTSRSRGLRRMQAMCQLVC